MGLKKSFKKIGKRFKKFFKSKVGQVVSTVLIAVASFYTGGAAAAAFGGGAVASAVVGGVAGAATGAVLGGGFAEVRGESFKSGAQSGAMTGLISGAMGGYGKAAIGDKLAPGSQATPTEAAPQPTAPAKPLIDQSSLSQQAPAPAQAQIPAKPPVTAQSTLEASKASSTTIGGIDKTMLTYLLTSSIGSALTPSDYESMSKLEEEHQERVRKNTDTRNIRIGGLRRKKKNGMINRRQRATQRTNQQAM